MKVTVITISDRASKGIYEDLSGQKIEKMLIKNIASLELNRLIVADEKKEILDALMNSLSSDFIFTTGGTGISPRDITPEVTRDFIDKELPGISEIIRAKSYLETPNSMLSRGISGIKGNSIIINFPGSLKAVTLCMQIVIPVLEHSIKMLKGEGH
jgi:molybdopterin adenylyltransferase